VASCYSCVEQKLAKCKLGISKWQQETFGCFKKTIYQLKKRLDVVQGREDE
jgi:hypothetical protein